MFTRHTELMKRLICVMCVAFMLSPRAPAQDVAGVAGELAAVQEAIKGISEAISQADVAVHDRLKQVQGELDAEVAQIQNVLNQFRAGVLQDANTVLNKTFVEANDLLYQATQGTLATEAAFEQGIANSLVNAANSISGIPFVNIDAYPAMAFPVRALPTRTTDLPITVVGYFKAKWPSPTAKVKTTGAALTVSTGINRILITVPRQLIQNSAGSPFIATIRYPAHKTGWWIFGSVKYAERDIVVNVLPVTAASYSILKAVQKDKPKYDYVTINPKQDNTEAGKCSTAVRYPSWPFTDLAAELNVNFTTQYDQANSTIVGPQVIARGGNNPDGQNDCAASVDAAGKLLVLYEKARGSCDHWDGGVFGSMHWGEGGNEFCRVSAQLQLLPQNQPPVPCVLVGGPLQGDLSWGNEVKLTKDPNGCSNPIVELSVQILDYSFNPPQARTISYIDYTSNNYFSDYIDAIPDDQGFHAWVRSFIDVSFATVDSPLHAMVANVPPSARPNRAQPTDRDYSVPSGNGASFPPEPACKAAGGPAACVQLCSAPIPNDEKVASVSVVLKDQTATNYQPCQVGTECAAGGAILHGNYYRQDLSQYLYQACWELRNWKSAPRDARISVSTNP